MVIVHHDTGRTVKNQQGIIRSLTNDTLLVKTFYHKLACPGILWSLSFRHLRFRFGKFSFNVILLL